MAFSNRKTCPNGHQYDAALYGDNCPFCPSPTSGETQILNYGGTDARTQCNTASARTELRTATSPTSGKTRPYSDEVPGGRTTIRVVGDNGEERTGRRVVGLLVSYTTNPEGDVFRLYEGLTVVGRDKACDIVVPDDAVSRQHLKIVYREADNRTFRLQDNMSSGGTFVNGSFEGDPIKLKANDVIVVGRHKFIFIPIPLF